MEKYPKSHLLYHKWKHLNKKVEYGTNFLNDLPLPISIQDSLNPVLVEVHERCVDISIILQHVLPETNDKSKIKLFQVKIFNELCHLFLYRDTWIWQTLH